MKNLKTSFKTRLIISFIVLLTSAVVSIEGKSFPDATLQERTATGFNKLNINGSFKVVLVQGNTEGVKVLAESEALNKIETKVENGTLKISCDKNFKPTGEMVVTINFKNIEDINCFGSTIISSEGQLKLDKLKFNSAGSVKADFDIATKSLGVDVSGSGNISLKGSAYEVELDISGSGKYSAGSLEADKYEIDMSGSGAAEIAVNSSLDISISGAGVIKYKGNPAITKDISGSGKVEKL